MPECIQTRQVCQPFVFRSSLVRQPGDVVRRVTSFAEGQEAPSGRLVHSQYGRPRDPAGQHPCHRRGLPSPYPPDTQGEGAAALRSQADALAGSRHSIRSDSATLATSLYHGPHDLQHVPLMTRKWRTSHKRHLRAHACGRQDFSSLSKRLLRSASTRAASVNIPALVEARSIVKFTQAGL